MIVLLEGFAIMAIAFIVTFVVLKLLDTFKGD